LPDDAVLKVPPDGFEGEMLAAFLNALATNPSFRRTVGANARAFVLREHTMRQAAEGYLDVLQDVTGRPLGHHLIREPTQPQPISPPAIANDAASALDPPDPATPTAEEDPMLTPIADALGDLGLAGNAALIEQTARALAEMHLGVHTAGCRGE
jgi:hypothetical protein